jgi:taurine dioxygenase
MKIVPLSPVLGSEAQDLDVSRELSDEVAEELRRAYTETHLVLVRGQSLSRDELFRYVSTYWKPSVTEGGVPAWTAISNVDERDGSGRGILLFHQDEAFTKDPAMGLSLYANDVSETSSPTSFVSTIRAREQLPDDLRGKLKDAQARQIIDVHCIDGDSTYRIKESELGPDAPSERYPRYDHPVFYPLGSTGSTVLFVSEHQTSHILGVPLDESERILEQCFAILYSEDNTYVHRWQRGDVIVWDNIAIQHGRPNVVDANPRDFWRLKTYNVAKVPVLARGPYAPLTDV